MCARTFELGIIVGALFSVVLDRALEDFQMKDFTWPATRKQLYAAGYSRAMQILTRPCKRCQVQIEFWHTPGRKSLMRSGVNPRTNRAALPLQRAHTRQGISPTD